jgi:amino acid transporter
MQSSESNDLVFARKSSGLMRDFSWLDVLILSISAPTGSGILFYSVNTQATYPGGSVVMAFLIGLLIFLPISFVIAMLATAMPRSGSLYVAVSRLMDSSVAHIGALLYCFGQAMIAGVLGNIITDVLGGLLSTAGAIYGVDALGSLGGALQSNAGKIIGGAIWVAIFWAVSLMGVKVLRRVVQTFFIIPLTATLATIVAFFLQSPETAQIAFNGTWGAGAFQRIQEIAAANGWSTPSFSWTATMGLLLVVLWSYNGIDMGSYAGSEVKAPETSFVKGVVLGWLCVGILYVVLAFAVVRPFGSFLGAYHFVVSKHPGALDGIMPAVAPSIPFYILSVVHNKVLGLLLGFSIVLWFVNCIPPIFLSTSRVLFALSMDRLAPQWLTTVNEKNGAPVGATHVTALVALLGVLFQTFSVSVVLGTLLFCTFFIFWMYGFAAMVLPYRMPNTYERLPFTMSIGGVALLSWAGLLTFCIGWFFVFLAAKEITLPVAAALTVLLLMIGVLYMVQVRGLNRSGISIKRLTESLPPE